MYKKTLVILLAVITITGCYSVSKAAVRDTKEVPFKERLTVGVIGFENKTGNPEYDDLARNITGTLINELQNTGHFRVIERERMKAILKELKFGLGGFVDKEKTKEIGKMLGVDALVMGNLSSVKYSRNKQTLLIVWTEGQKVVVNADARLVNVETGEILASSKASTSIKQRNWVAFWFARLGRKTDKRSIIQTGIDEDCRILANDLAYKAPLKSEIK